MLAADAVSSENLQLAKLAPETIERLNAILPAHWSHGNPVDIIGDAPVERYVAALRPLTQDRNADAILLIGDRAIHPRPQLASRPGTDR